MNRKLQTSPSQPAYAKQHAAMVKSYGHRARVAAWNGIYSLTVKVQSSRLAFLW